jgi:hypothetical protein
MHILAKIKGDIFDIMVSSAYPDMEHFSQRVSGGPSFNSLTHGDRNLQLKRCLPEAAETLPT